MRTEGEGFRLEISSGEAEALYLLLRNETLWDSAEISSIHKKLEAQLFAVLSIEEMESLDARPTRGHTALPQNEGGSRGRIR
jgi:hypothetical protein